MSEGPGAALARELSAIVEVAEPRLRALSDEASAYRPAPGKWSAHELVGHLIDSAANNHGRRLRALLSRSPVDCAQ